MNEMPDPCTIALQTDKQLMDIHNTVADRIVDRDELQDNVINRIIDGMDIDGLCQLAYDYLNENYDKYSVDELITEAEEMYPDMFED